jgi:hypothetical protein
VFDINFFTTLNQSRVPAPQPHRRFVFFFFSRREQRVQVLFARSKRITIVKTARTIVWRRTYLNKISIIYDSARKVRKRIAPKTLINVFENLNGNFYIFYSLLSAGSNKSNLSAEQFHCDGIRLD